MLAENFDTVVLATGVKPRKLELEGANHKKVLTYLDVLDEECFVGRKVAIIGAGGIGIDVAHYLTSQTPFSSSMPEYLKSYDILNSEKALALLKPKKREVTVLQRSSEKIGKRLGKTTGWTHIQTLKSHGVKLVTGANYIKIDDEGLHFESYTKKGDKSEKMIIDVDNVIVAAGQEPKLEFGEELSAAGLEVFIIGGARQTQGLDANTAIAEGAELASKL